MIFQITGCKKNMTPIVQPNMIGRSELGLLCTSLGNSFRATHARSQPIRVPSVLVSRSLMSVARKVNICRISMAKETAKPNKTVRAKRRKDFQRMYRKKPNGTKRRTFSKVALSSENMDTKGSRFRFRSNRMYVTFGRPTTA